MIKVSVFYPNEGSTKFDTAYYLGKHMPMVKAKFGALCKGAEVDFGLGGAEPGSKPVYVAMAHFLFESVETFQKAFGPHAGAIMADIPKYTDVPPVIQLSEVKM